MRSDTTVLAKVYKAQRPTTEVLRPDTTGSATSRQRFSSRSHAAMRFLTSSGSVATLTLDRPLAQAQVLTSHIKVKTAETTKSWRKQNYEQLSFTQLLISVHHHWFSLFNLMITIMCILVINLTFFDIFNNTHIIDLSCNKSPAVVK